MLGIGNLLKLKKIETCLCGGGSQFFASGGGLNQKWKKRLCLGNDARGSFPFIIQLIPAAWLETQRGSHEDVDIMPDNLIGVSSLRYEGASGMLER